MVHCTRCNDQSPPQSGQAISTWFDRSGNGHNAHQDDPSRRPIYVRGSSDGKGVVRFDGHTTPNGDELDIDNSGAEFDLNDATIFAVVARRFDNILSNPGIFAVRSEQWTRISMHLIGNASGWIVWNGGIATYLPEAQFSLAQLYLLDATWDLGYETRRTNGVVIETYLHPWNVVENYRPVHIGWSGNSTEHLNGNIAEIIVFDKAISALDRDLVADYLAEKWAIELP